VKNVSGRTDVLIVGGEKKR